MKKTLIIIALLLFHFTKAQQTTLQVVNKNLVTVSGQTITLRGINYPLIDDGNINPADAVSYQFYINEAAKTGANAIRLPWYTNGVHWRDVQTPGTLNGYNVNGHLNNIIAYCISKKMIPILEIHDLTCSDDWSSFNTTVMNFWTSPSVLALIENNKSHLIINLANEFDKVRWANNPTKALTTFKNNYNTAIATLRNAGIKVPIMIDAPDCGQSSSELLSIAESMNATDSIHNLVFSAHAYWGGYAATLAQIQTKLNEAQSKNVCFLLGEVAKNQDDGSCGNLNLASIYPQILTEAGSRNIGWLAWTYAQDCSVAREMTTNGTFGTLTSFGNDIVNNTIYGLKSTSGYGATVLSNGKFSSENLKIAVFPNPSKGQFTIETEAVLKKVQVYDVVGKEMKLIKKNSGNYEIYNPKVGIYFLKIETENGYSIAKKINVQ